MVYQVSAGIYRDANELLGRFLSGALPLAASLVLVGLFSYSSHFASGTQPVIAAPKNLSLSIKPTTKSSSVPASSPNTSTQPPPTTQSTASSTSTFAPLAGANLPSPTDTSSSVPPTGGLGGGGLDSGTSGTDSGGLLPATITTPPLDLQAGDKQILSTDGTSLTIN